MKKSQIALIAVFAATMTACSSNAPINDPDLVLEEVTPSEPIEIPEEITRPFPPESFYDLLVAEFALRRDRFDLALGNYLQQAHETRDLGVAKHTTRLAQYLKADKATLDAAQLWIELEPDNIEVHYILSVMQAKVNRPLEAMENMRFVLEKGGKTNFAYIAATSLPLSQATRDQLLNDFEGLLKDNPLNPQLMIGRTLLLQRDNQLEEALAQIRKVIRYDSEDLQAISIETNILQQLQRNDEALRRLAQVVEDNPKEIRLRLQYARLLMQKDISQAKEQFEILLADSPQDPDLLFSLALINKDLNDVEAAKTYLLRLLQTGSRTNEANLYLGDIADTEGDWQQAIRYFKNVTPSQDWLKAITRVTKLYNTNNQLDNARNYLQSLRQQYPENAIQFHLIETDLLINANELSEASKLLDAALLVTPSNIDLLYARSMVNEKNNNLEQMERDLNRILQLDPNNVIALNALGYVLTNNTTRYEEAYQLIKRAIELKPEDPAITDSLGWVQYKRGNLTEARRLLQKAYDAYPDPEVAAHLGEVLWQLGEQEQATAIWNRARQQSPDNQIILETVNRFIPPTQVAEPELESTETEAQ